MEFLSQDEINTLNQGLINRCSYVSEQLKALKNSVTSETKGYWYLKDLQNKTPLLKLISDELLVNSGSVVLNNINNLFTRPVIALILKSIFGANADITFKPLGGALDIDISNTDGLIRETMFLQNGDSFNFKNGDTFELEYYSTALGQDIEGFLYEFLECGVFLRKLNIIEDGVQKILIDNGKIMVSGNQILTNNKGA